MKIFYLDLETTGTDPAKHGIIQIAYLVEIDGKEHQRGEFRVRPFDFQSIEPDALEVNGVSVDDLAKYPQPNEVYQRLVNQVLQKYVDKFDKADKFNIAGYNVGFDLQFLKQFFVNNGDNYFGSWFNYDTIDPLPVLRFFQPVNPWIAGLPNKKLATVAKALGIDLDNAHDALPDILATKEIIDRIHRKYEGLFG